MAGNTEIPANWDGLASRRAEIERQNLDLLFTKQSFTPEEAGFAGNIGMAKSSVSVTLCQHMERVKSLRNGWYNGWQRTRDGELYTVPGDSDTGWYRLLSTHTPSRGCPCLRLVPVGSPLPPSNPPSSHSQCAARNTGIVGECGNVLPALDRNPPPLATPTTQSDSVTVCGGDLVETLHVIVPAKMVPHPALYSRSILKSLSPDPNRTKQMSDRKRGNMPGINGGIGRLQRRTPNMLPR